MKIYLMDKETNEIIQTFDNVIEWSSDFVEYNNSGYRAKMYCSDNEYFTDIEVIVEETD
jgi:hypothetical protein